MTTPCGIQVEPLRKRWIPLTVTGFETVGVTGVLGVPLEAPPPETEELQPARRTHEHRKEEGTNLIRVCSLR
jgi:hypothetical protein